ncbi:MAG: glutamine synthetase, partial [Calditrichae bacterium]|nr:glutamine synthetase [Calditrichia bacterium]
MEDKNLPGKIDAKTLKNLIENEQIETVLTAFPDLYGRLIGKRINGRFFLDEVLDDSMHACDYLLACDMEMDPVQGYKYTSWADGYGDIRLVPQLSTLRIASWPAKTAIILCDVFEEESDKLVDIAPRSI